MHSQPFSTIEMPKPARPTEAAPATAPVKAMTPGHAAQGRWATAFLVGVALWCQGGLAEMPGSTWHDALFRACTNNARNATRK